MIHGVLWETLMLSLLWRIDSMEQLVSLQKLKTLLTFYAPLTWGNVYKWDTFTPGPIRLLVRLGPVAELIDVLSIIALAYSIL